MSESVRLDPYSAEGRKKATKYAWMTTIGIAMLSMVNVGIGMSSFSLFYRILLTTYEATATQISMFYTIEGAVCAVIVLFAGWYVEKLSFKVLSVIGVLATAIQMFLIAYGPGLPTLYLAGVLAAVGQAAGGFGILLAIPPRWFARGASLATNIGKIGSSLTGIILSPVIATIITNQGYQTGGAFAGVFVLVVGLIASIFLVRRCPEDYGLVPVGAEKPTDDAVLQAPPVAVGMTQKESMKTTRFWILMITVSLFFSIGSQGLTSQISNIMALRGFELIQVGYYNSFRSFAALAIGFLNSWLMDRFGFRPMYVIMGFSFVAGLGVLMFANSFPLMIVYSLLSIFAGPCSSNWVPIALSNMYGRKAVSGLHGVNNVFGAAGASLGPIITASIYGATSYENAMLALIPIILVSIAGGYFVTQKKYVLFPAPKKEKKETKTATA